MTSVWTNLVETLAQPTAAFRRMRSEPKVGGAILVAVVARLATQAGTASSFAAALGHGLGFVVWFAVFVAVIHGVARLFRGRGAFAGTATALGFSLAPLILQALAYVIASVAGIPNLVALSELATAIWFVALFVLALREAHQISTARSIGVMVVVLGLAGVAAAFFAIGSVLAEL